MLSASNQSEDARRSRRQPGADEDGGRVATPAAPHLPAPFSSSIGLEHDVAEVAKLLGTSDLVTLVGPGGVGKTRLALEVAHDLAPSYPDGAWFVPLDELGDPGLLAAAVASASR